MPKNPDPDTLTLWRRRKYPMNTQWGVLPYYEWCVRESARINARGGETVVAGRKSECCIKERYNGKRGNADRS